MVWFWDFDAAYVVGDMVAEILGRKFPIDVYLDSKTVFDTVTRLTPTLEKRLFIDVYAVQESHKKGELRSIYWIPSDSNLSDPLTKVAIQPKSALRKLIETSKLEVNPTGWICGTQGNQKFKFGSTNVDETSSANQKVVVSVEEFNESEQTE
jgi:hypothetical protein